MLSCSIFDFHYFAFSVQWAYSHRNYFLHMIYDLIIIGFGPAGVAASIYASRYKLSHLVFGKLPGGLISTSHLVDNYPGLEEISGLDLGDKFLHHVQKFNPDGVRMSLIRTIEKDDQDIFTLTDSNGDTFQAKSILLALGTKYRRLGIPGEDEFEGKGVTWCATCDAFFYKKKDVAVIGGGDSALEAAYLLAGIAENVYVIHRGPVFRAEPTWVDMTKTFSNVHFVMENELASINGENGKVVSVSLKKSWDGRDLIREGEELGLGKVNREGQDLHTISLKGVFVEIGSDPLVDLPNQLRVELDEYNYVRVHADQSTNIPGVYAAGDFTTGSNKFRQVLPAMSEGVVAVSAIYNYLSQRGNA